MGKDLEKGRLNWPRDLALEETGHERSHMSYPSLAVFLLRQCPWSHQRAVKMLRDIWAKTLRVIFLSPATEKLMFPFSRRGYSYMLSPDGVLQRNPCVLGTVHNINKVPCGVQWGRAQKLASQDLALRIATRLCRGGHHFVHAQGTQDA